MWTRRKALMAGGAATLGTGVLLGRLSWAEAPTRPQGRVLTVSPDGDDSGTGSEAAPFRTPSQAARLAQPGDTIMLRPGRYPPFAVHTNGTSDRPITFTTRPGEERQAVIDGGGRRTRGIAMVARDHIALRNLAVQNCGRSAIYFESAPGARHGHITIENCLVQDCDSVGIFVCGYHPYPGVRRPLGTVEAENILIERNTVRRVNRAVNASNECITVCGAIRNVITRFNRIHDSGQYGIDYKEGFEGGGEIYGNSIWSIEKHGIYLDTGRRRVHGVRVHDNLIWNCETGVAIAREANLPGYAQTDPEWDRDLLQSLDGIDVYNNVIFGMRVSGLYMSRHPRDTPHGAIRNIRIRFNTIYEAGTGGTGSEADLDNWFTPSGTDGDGAVWSSSDWTTGVTVSGIEFIGNLLYRPGSGRGIIDGEAEWSANATWVDNHYSAGDGDPLFVDPAVTQRLPSGVDGGPLPEHPATFTPRGETRSDLFGDLTDFRLRASSSARASVTGYSEAPFDVDADGNSRLDPANAGAY